MPNQELKEKALRWLDVLRTLKDMYGGDEIANKLSYIGNATPQKLAKDLNMSEEKASEVIELTKKMIECFRFPKKK